MRHLGHALAVYDLEPHALNGTAPKCDNRSIASRLSPGQQRAINPPIRVPKASAHSSIRLPAAKK